MKNLRHSRKALSPVVASIILIAVTVAVSIAVAAWMGALTTGFMATEELKITNVAFTEASGAVTDITISIRNTGSTAVTITDVYISNTLVTAASDLPTTGLVLDANEAGEIVIDVTDSNFPTSLSIDPGTSYQFKVMSSKGNVFVYTATAPI